MSNGLERGSAQWSKEREEKVKWSRDRERLGTGRERGEYSGPLTEDIPTSQ